MKLPYQTKRRTYRFPLPSPNILTTFQLENQSNPKFHEVPKMLGMGGCFWGNF
jgi:hypothetical protein